MIHGLILAVLGFSEIELGMRAAHGKLYSPETKPKLVYKQEVSNFALILIKILRKNNSVNHRSLCTITQAPPQ